MYYQNVRGLRTKSTTFYLSTTDCNHDVIVLTETWLNSSHQSTEYFNNDFNVYRRDRTVHTRSNEFGGGVLIAIRSSLNSDQVLIPEADMNIEFICTKIKLKHKNIFIYGMYIKPNSTLETYEAHLHAIGKINANPEDDVFIFGDFNLPSVRWFKDPDDSCFLPLNLRSEVELSLDSLFGLGYKQLNGQTNCAGNVLDLIFAADCDNVHIMTADTPLSKIDIFHPPIEVHVDCVETTFVPCKDESRLCFKRADYNAMNEYISSFDYTRLFANAGVDECTAVFTRILDEAIAKNVPTITHRSWNHPPWYSRDLLKLRNKKNKAFKAYHRSRLVEDYKYFSSLRTEFSIMQKFLYDNYMEDIQNNIIENPRKFWNYVNLKKKTNGYPTTMSYGGCECSNVQDICDSFANFFEENYVDQSGPMTQPEDLSSDGLGEIEVQYDSVLTALQSIDTSKSSGPSNFPPVMLKNCAQTVAKPLHLLFTKSLEVGIFPSTWKSSFITPIFKSGARNKVENYRGVAILQSIPKLFEKIVYKTLAAFIHPHLSIVQHGFMPSRSCTTNMLEFTNFVLNSLSNAKQVDALFTDFAKAFDRVSHPILLQKLRAIGIHSTALRWIQTYLSGRTQNVKIGGIKSRSINVKSGVPQGSHLGLYYS